MFRATGAGQVEVDAAFSGVSTLKALLYNFDFDDYADLKYHPLKDAHASFLADKVIPLLENDTGSIWMLGSASRIGSNAWNMETSQVRVGRVADFLIKKGITTEQIQQNAVGEELAAKHSEDDPRDRSVTLWVIPRFKFDPPRPPKPPVRVPRKPPVSQNFKIAMLGAVSVAVTVNAVKLLKKVKLGGALTLDDMYLMIWDTRNNISCVYLYVAPGIGVGVSIMPNVSATTHGPWTAFTTEKPISCWQFGEYARFTSAGAFNKSINWITMRTPPGVNDINHLRIETGTTLGGGLSSTVGSLTLVDKPRRFSGP
jgi:hypothetical protein